VGKEKDHYCRKTVMRVTRLRESRPKQSEKGYCAIGAQANASDRKRAL